VLTDPLYPGISVFKLTPDQLIDQVEEVNRINPNGVSLFAAAHLTEGDYQRLAQGVFSVPALLPDKNKRESLAKMQDFILKRLNIIKEAEAIETDDLIKIRTFLNQICSKATKADFNFLDYVEKNNLNLSEKVTGVLEKDFNYLKDIINLY